MAKAGGQNPGRLKCPVPGCRRLRHTHNHIVPERSGERETIAHFVISVPFYGNDAARDKLHLSVARALHHGVGANVGSALCEVWDEQDMPDGDQVWVSHGPLLTLDPLGDDMGHHGPEHNTPLVPKESQ